MYCEMKKKISFSGFEGVFLSMGKSAGIGIANGWSVPSWFLAWFKSKDLFVTKYWGMMNQKVPKY